MTELIAKNSERLFKKTLTAAQVRDSSKSPVSKKDG